MFNIELPLYFNTAFKILPIAPKENGMAQDIVDYIIIAPAE